jgi:hypothetical protein
VELLFYKNKHMIMILLPDLAIVFCRIAFFLFPAADNEAGPPAAWFRPGRKESEKTGK